MKTIKKFTFSAVAALAVASPASALTTFGVGTQVSPGVFTRSILLDGNNVGTLDYNITGSGADWSTEPNFLTNGAIVDNVLNFTYRNTTTNSVQPFLTQFNITLNPGISVAGPITIGAGGTAQIGLSNVINVAFSVNQPGTLAITQPSLWIGAAPGAYTANSVFQSDAAISGSGDFGEWSIDLAPTTTSFQYNHLNVIKTPGSQSQNDAFALRFDVVPEPSSMMLSALGALGLLARRRRN